MKTKDLIAELQRADPSGEIEVSVGNTDIHFVGREPAYYDGCLQVLKRAGRADRYDIVGVEFRGEGQKVVITPLSAWEAISEDPEIPITFDGNGPRVGYADRVEAYRVKARETNASNTKLTK